MTLQILNPNTDKAVVFDTETGLVIHHTVKIKSKIPTIDKYIGIDTKWPDDCVTKDSLIACLSLLDGYLNNDVIVNNQVILNSIFEEHLTEQQAKLVNYISNNLTAWNYYIGSVKDLYMNVGISPKNIAAMLSKLEPNAIRVLHRNKPFKGDIVIKINPFYGWKGNYRLVEHAKDKWYSHNYKHTPIPVGVNTPVSQ